MVKRLALFAIERSAGRVIQRDGRIRSQWTHAPRDERTPRTGQLDGEFRTAPVDGGKLRRKTELLQLEPARPERVRRNQTRASIEVFAVDLLNQLRMGEIQRVIAGIERLPALVQQRAERAITEDDAIAEQI